MNNLIKIVFLFIILGCQSTVEEKNPAFIATVDSLIQHEIDNGNIPGAVIRIQQDDSVLLEKAYGYAQEYEYGMKPLEKPEPMTTTHLFDLASLTKVCGTTFGIMMLTDRGEIQLDDPVYKWLPEFYTERKRNITIRHLLTHTAGLYQWKPTYYYASNLQGRYDYITNLPLEHPVGEARYYSDLGFMLLGDIIQRVSGQPLDEFLKKNLFIPLNLEHTVFNPLEKGYIKIAATSHGNLFEKHMVYDDSFGYKVDVDPESWDGWRRYTLKGEVNDGNAWYTHGGVAGHAGLFSTAGDLQKLITLLLNQGTYKEEQLLSEAVIDSFLTKDSFGNGLGWAMNPKIFGAEGSPEGTFGHTGFTGTSIAVIPKYKLSIILLTNRQNVGPQENGYYFDLNPLRQGIVDVVLENV